MTAVLLDLDGTLMDTPAAILCSLREMSGPESDSWSDDDLRQHIGRPLDRIVEALLPGHGERDRHEAAQRFRASFARQTVPDATHLVVPGALAAVRRLRAMAIPTAVVTSKITSSAIELLEAGGIMADLDAVVGHDQAAAGKPAPDLALHAARVLGVDARSAVVVGDSPDDMLMGRAAGMRTVGVLWGIGDEGRLRAAGADEVVAAPDDLALLLTDLCTSTPEVLR